MTSPSQTVPASTPDTRFAAWAAQLGHSFDGELVIGGIYTSTIRHGDQVFITFDLPGIDPDAIELTVERDMLTVKAERRFQRSEGDQVLAEERRQGTFTRRVLLGETLDTEKLEAAYDHGVLSVTIPVAQAAQPRRIAVGGGHAQEAIETSAVEA